MNNRTALILKLARSKQNEKPSCSATTTVLGNDWKVVREEEVAETELIVGQAPFKVKPEQIAHPYAEFQVCTQDDTPSNNYNTTVRAIVNVTELRVGNSNLGPSKRSPLVPSDNLNFVNKSYPKINQEVKQYVNKADSSSDSDATPSNNRNFISVRAMVHDTEARVTDSNSGVKSKLENNSRPKRNQQLKQYFNQADSSSDSEIYDSDKDPMYEPDLNDDFKLQKQRKLHEVMTKIAVRRTERQKEKERDFDAIEVMEEDFDGYDENVEYNIMEKADGSVQKKQGKKRSLNKDNWSKNRSKKLRNSGEAYISSSKTKKEIPKKELKPPCKDNCRINCKTKITVVLHEDQPP